MINYLCRSGLIFPFFGGSTQPLLLTCKGSQNLACQMKIGICGLHEKMAAVSLGKLLPLTQPFQTFHQPIGALNSQIHLNPEPGWAKLKLGFTGLQQLFNLSASFAILKTDTAPPLRGKNSRPFSEIWLIPALMNLAMCLLTLGLLLVTHYLICSFKKLQTG